MATDARWDMAFRRNNVRTFTIRLKGVDLTGKTMRQQVRLAPDTPGAPVIALETVTSATAEGLRLASVEVVDGAPVSTIIGRYNLTTMRDKLPYGGEVGDDYPMVHEIEIDGKTRFYGRWVARGTVMDSDGAPSQREPLAAAQRSRVSADTVEMSATISADEAIEVTLEGTGELGALLGAAAGFTVRAEAAAVAATEASDRLPFDATAPHTLFVIPDEQQTVIARIDANGFQLDWKIGNENVSALAREGAAKKGLLDIELPDEADPYVLLTVNEYSGDILQSVRQSGSGEGGSGAAVTSLAADADRLANTSGIATNLAIPVFITSQIGPDGAPRSSGPTFPGTGNFPYYFVVAAAGDGATRTVLACEGRPAYDDFVAGKQIVWRMLNHADLSLTSEQPLFASPDHQCGNPTFLRFHDRKLVFAMMNYVANATTAPSQISKPSVNDTTSMHLAGAYLLDGETKWRGAGGAVIDGPITPANCINLDYLREDYPRWMPGPGSGLVTKEGFGLTPYWTKMAETSDNGLYRAGIFRLPPGANIETGWLRGWNAAQAPDGVSESFVVDMGEGVIGLDSRSEITRGGAAYRRFTKTSDYGLTITYSAPRTDRPPRECQNNGLALSGTSDKRSRRTLISGIDSTLSRRNLAVWLSYEGGATLALKYRLYPNADADGNETVTTDFLGVPLAGGPVTVVREAEYSCLFPMGGDRFGILYNENIVRPSGALTTDRKAVMLRVLNLSDLINKGIEL